MKLSHWQSKKWILSKIYNKKTKETPSKINTQEDLTLKERISEKSLQLSDFSFSACNIDIQFVYFSG